MIRQGKRVLRALINRCKVVYLSFGSAVACPICGWTGRSFLRVKYSDKPADILVCPSCRSSERHRFAYLALRDELTNQADDTLHFAPEKCIEPWLRAISREYLSVDLSAEAAMEHMDITDLRLPDDRFSLLWCSHVLEHIENDRLAMVELFRVLRPSGKAVIMVPIYGEQTYENPEITSPAERLQHFKQEDHVRLYGLDIVDRLRDTGFSVEVLRVSDISSEKVDFHGLDYPSTREIFFCTKP
jgi:predicted SAM-dependent methyltransferase